MKSNKGITLVGLIMYVVAFVIIVGIVGTITSFFYSNTQDMNDTATSLGEFNKFNLEMVRETKLEGNKVYSVSNKEGNTYVNVDVGQEGTRIVFTSGTSFTYIAGEDNSIYKDRVKICSNVKECKFKVESQEEKQVVSAFIIFDNFSRTVKYVMQENKVKTNANSEESFTTASGKNYVQNGLVLHYDAINNTGDGHSNSTDVWRDLSPNHNDAVLKENFVWNDDNFKVSSARGWADCGEHNYEVVTLSVCFEADTLTAGQERELICNYNSGGYGIHINGSNIVVAANIRGDGYIRLTDSNEITTGKKYYVVGTYDQTYFNLYINGVLVGTLEREGEVKKPTYNTHLAIGVNLNGDDYDGGQFIGKIYSAAVYNRVLTAEEIMNNYQIDKARYGIED